MKVTKTVTITEEKLEGYNTAYEALTAMDEAGLTRDLDTYERFEFLLDNGFIPGYAEESKDETKPYNRFWEGYRLFMNDFKIV